MGEIKTYPKMNEMIKEHYGDSEDFGQRYAAARIIELEEALDFYADEDNWSYELNSNVVEDGGQKARKALERT